VATPGESTVRCGGNTPCVEVRCGPRVIIFDAGTGIRPLGRVLERERVQSIDLLISHLHMDHLQGFPFFTPAYQPGTRLRIHVPGKSWTAPWEPFEHLMRESNFPVQLSRLPAEITFAEVDGRFRLGEVQVTTQPVNHPGGGLSYRLEYEGRSFVYLTDHEPYRRQFPDRPDSAARDLAVMEFTRGADLVVREAQYTDEEYPEHRGWGHSTSSDAVQDALAGGVRRVALFHHDPDHDDSFLETELARLQAAQAGAGLEIHLAREGQTIELA
jgi:phosphoribosyl 1,2-cyclic phosphodiesterase